MKKNLLSVLILALLVVNIVLTTIMMVSVLSVNGKTGALVTQIATVLNLELTEPGSEEDAGVPLSQTATYSIDKLMIQLKHNEDGSGADMIIFDMSIAMDTEHEDYKELGSEDKLAGFEVQIKDAVESVVKQYTEEECRNNFEQVRMEILTALQQLFQSDFIYRVSISGVMYQ